MSRVKASKATRVRSSTVPGPGSCRGDLVANSSAAPPKQNSLLRRWNGPFSEELRLDCGGFGLGQVPARKIPDATTRVVCGFCSTGCSLDIHLKDGIAVNLTPTADYPVNDSVHIFL